MGKPRLSPADFPLCAAALAAWRGAHDPQDALGLAVDHFVPRGRTIQADLSFRSLPAAPGVDPDRPRTTLPVLGADDAALAAAVRHQLEFTLPKLVQVPVP